MKVTLKAPTAKNNYWYFNRKRYKTVYSVYYRLERLFKGQSKRSSMAVLQEKTQVIVIYDQLHGLRNETLKSLDVKYLLRLTAQFLDDYALIDWVKEKEKEYAI